MNGIVFLENIAGGQGDLLKKIAKVGYNETPLFSSIQKGVPSNKTKPFEGHSWQYEESEEGDDNNAHLEGSAPADATSNILGVSKNHYQIIKDTYGVTGSSEYVETTEGQRELQRQGALKTQKHRKTIEKMMFKENQAPVQRSTSVAGESASLYHWASVENRIDATNATLTMALLRKLLKLGWAKGVPTTHIFVSDTQKDIIDDLLDAKVRIGQGGNVIKATNYTQMKNLSYAPDVKFILTPYVADNKILAVNHASLALVFHRLTQTKDIPTGDDVVKKQLITELTLRVNNPYAVTVLESLGK